MEKQRRGSGLGLTEGHTTPQNLEISKKLRTRTTPAEQFFWAHVRRRRYPGYRFRRNHPLSGFSVDFYCDALRLVIEIDGEIHQYTKERDKERTAVLERLGVRVIRFTNEEVLHNLPSVMRRIFATKPTEPESPSRE